MHWQSILSCQKKILKTISWIFIFVQSQSSIEAQQLQANAICIEMNVKHQYCPIYFFVLCYPPKPDFIFLALSKKYIHTAFKIISLKVYNLTKPRTNRPTDDEVLPKYNEKIK